jgi:hypothetical protein
MDTIGADAIKSRALSSPLASKYAKTIDRESAYELLAAKMAAAAPEAEPAPVPGRAATREEEESAAERIMKNPAVRSFLRSAASTAGRQITRSLFGTRRR